jgi:hypothetical protein
MDGKVIVYLDTQDFSRFADCLNGRGTPGAQTVLDVLLPEIDAGRVICPVSMAHLSELLQYDGGGRDLTLRKAEAVERLSGPYAFRNMNDMLAADLIDFAEKKGFLRQPPMRPRYFPLDEDGQWHPSVGRVLNDLKGEMERQLAVSLKEESNLSRAMRRKAKAVVRTKGWAEVLSGPDAEQRMREFASSYPVTERFISERLFQKLLLGQIKREAVEAELFKGLRQPTRFVTWYFERYDGERDLPNWMRSLGRDLASTLVKMKDGLSMIDAPPSTQFTISAEQSREFALSISARLFAEVASELKPLGLGQHAIDRLLADPERASTPTISVLTALATQTIKKHTARGPNSPKVEDGDGGDLIHALYVPHCHIWRGDKRSAELVRQTFPKLKTLVVGKLHELPAALNNASAF